MKTLYDLNTELKDDPERFRRAQALTLDDSRPNMGLAGTFGLYGSDRCWGNLRGGQIPTRIYEGSIESLHFVGQGNNGVGQGNNGRAFTLICDDGTPYTYSLVANEKADLRAYQTGRRLRVTVFYEPKKNGESLEMVWTIEIDDD